MTGGNEKKHIDALFTMDLEDLRKGPGNASVRVKTKCGKCLAETYLEQ